jgi:3-oxoacyl-[acyl-carrier-protein] synthase-3
MALGIERISSYFPSRTVPAEQLASDFGFDVSFVRGKLGIEKIFVADENERASDMAAAALARLIADVPGLADRIDALVVCTQTPDYQLPHVSAIVHERAGLSDRVAAFDISLGCSGFVYGLSVLEAFLERNGLSTGVLITSETYSKVIDDTDQNTKCLFSDAAAATLVSDRGRLRAGRYTFGTAGKKHDHLIVRPAIGHETAQLRRLSMNGRGIFDFVIGSIPADIQACLEANELTLADLDLLVFHQASGFMLDMLAKRLGVSGDARMVRTLAEHGNTVSSSIPLALQPYVDDEQARRVLISGFGVGLSWASTILRSEGGAR